MSEHATQKSTDALSSAELRDDASPAYRLGDDFSQLKHARIMMVDDEPITMEAVQTFLEDAGYTNFLLVEDSMQAVAELERYRPDVLLLDVVMPGLSGFDILKMLRARQEFGHLPVIILTSSTDGDTKLNALDLGATDFLSKPVDPSELALRVRNTLAAKAYQDQLAYYDAQTNLPNHRLFVDRAQWALDRAQRDGDRVVVLHLVFEQYRRVVDSFGPKAGDELIRRLAQRLTDNLRQSDLVGQGQTGSSWDTVFRIGSEDFVVLLPRVGEVGAAAQVGQRILDELRQPVTVAGTEVYLTPSIGIAAYPDDCSDVTSLIKLARGASSQARIQGGGRLQFFSPEMNRATVKRLQLEAALRRAVDNGDFQLVYQPQVAVADGCLVGVEALLRWRRPDGEPVSPMQFIPLAEEIGLIAPLGEWVLVEACKQLAWWRAAGIDTRVSVNISPRQFFDTDLNAVVRDVLQQSGIAPAGLTLEVTESLLMDDVDKALRTLAQLRELGVEISIDDFGTGYSSLSYLKRFAVDELKIDRSFLCDGMESRDDQALVTAINYLAHQLQLRVCAEGVEQTSQLDFLKRIGCDLFQGFLCSRPQPADRVAVALQRGQWVNDPQ